MISRIYVIPKKGSRADSYLVDSNLSKKKLERLAWALTNPILENYYINEAPHVGNFSYVIEIGFKPGVTDNVANTVKEIAKDLLHLKKDFGVYTSKIFFVSEAKFEKVKLLASTLYNPLIERAEIVRVEKRKINLPFKAPKVLLHKSIPVINVSLKVSDEELVKIGKEGIRENKNI